MIRTRELLDPRSLRWLALATALLVAACGRSGSQDTPGVAPGSAPSGSGATGAAPGTGTAGGATRPASPLTITGMVVDESGRPVAGAAVQVSGKPATVTDGSGHFAAAGVMPPYDVSAVFSRSATESYATVVQGLTRADPTVKVSYDPTTAWSRAWVTGAAATAAGPATPETVRTVVLLAAPDAHREGWADSTTGAYATGAQLDPFLYVGLPRAETGALYALQATVDASGEPTGYSWFGATSGLRLAPGAQLAGQDVALSTPVQTGGLSGILAVPGLGSAAASLSLSLPGEAGWLLWRGDLAGPFSVFDIPTPTFAGATFDVTFSAYDPDMNRTAATLRGLAPSVAGLA
ncbi:MAG TPA: carboxypeptidase-like regulatory domain-containing protein, partial [Anaeromyxobacteraceae bacterium]